MGIAVLATTACAEPWTEDASSAENDIFGGEADEGPRALGSVVALKVGEGSPELCSGVLIAPNVVLTARHCVAVATTRIVACDENGRSVNGQHVDGEQAPEAVGVYTGSSPSFIEDPAAVGKAIVAPKNDHLCDSDIALVVLEQSIPGVEPIAVRLEGGVAAGETIRSVGYGRNDQRKPFGTRLRKGGVPVLAMGSQVSESRTPLGPHEFEVGRSICQGDSGGPAISEDTGAVVGVVSRGNDCNADFGHIYTSTSGWQELFDAAFAIAGGAPIVETGRPVAPAAAPVAPPAAEPEPASERARTESCSFARGPGRGSASFMLALAGAAALIATRRRSRQGEPSS